MIISKYINTIYQRIAQAGVFILTTIYIIENYDDYKMLY